MSQQSQATLAHLLSEYDSTAHNDEDRNWLRGFLRNVALEARSGRLIPIDGGMPKQDEPQIAAQQAEPTQAEKQDEFWQTEGSLLDLIRATIDGQDSLLVEHVEFLGDVSTSRADVGVSLTAVVLLEIPEKGEATVNMRESAERARKRVREALARHSQLRVGVIDVRLSDVVPLPRGEGWNA